jgi:hypothetical protein
MERRKTLDVVDVKTDLKNMSFTNWAEILLLKLMRSLRTLNFTRIVRLGFSSYKFTDYFRGMEKVEAVRETFGGRTEEVLQNLRIEFTFVGGYMFVNNSNGHLMISSKYLRNGDRIDIYLDLIHELVHIKQLMEGKELFDVHYGYTERPTEIEAYRAAVREARRMGLSDDRICQYLKTEWMSVQDFRKLADAMNVRCGHWLSAV